MAATELGRGAGLLPALRSMAERAAPPLRTRLEPLRRLESGGARLEAGLFALRGRAADPGMVLLAHTVAIAPRAVSPPQALLLRLARRLRRRAAGERRRAALLRPARQRAGLLSLAFIGLPFLPLLLRPASARAWLATSAGCALFALAVLLAAYAALGLLRAVRTARTEV